MKSFALFRDAGPSGWTQGAGLDGPELATGRRRVAVFCGVFLAVAVVGLTYTFVRPAQYRATARLEITPPGGLTPAPVSSTGGGTTIIASAPASGTDVAPSLPGQIQVLTSRPLLEQAWERLSRAGQVPDDLRDGGPGGLQERLGAAAIEGSQVVELWADGRDAAGLPFVVNTLIQVYVRHVADSYRSASADDLERAREEAAKLEQEVTARRARVRDFQLRYGIVSQERDEHALLNRAKAMSTALSAANEKVVKAEATLRSARESAAMGRSSVRAKDNPTLAGIEQRISQLREELRDLERSYAPAYLAMDPQVRTKRNRLAELEEQLVTERAASQRTAIAQAEEDLATARDAAYQLQQQMAGDRREIQEFSLRFGEYKSMQLELAEVEALQRGAQERAVRLEASESARRPAVEVIQWAEAPREPRYPHYGRDAAISLGAAFGLALLAVWLVDYLRPRPAAPSLAMPRVWVPVPLPQAPPPDALPATEMGRLPAAPNLPRELAEAEVGALLAATGGPARLAVATLLAGLSPEEARALGWGDVDRERGTVRIGGAAPRDLPLAGMLRTELERAGLDSVPAPAGPVLHDGQGRALGPEGLDGLLLSAAHDAGLEAPADVTAAALRHTYLAYLVRQGVRFSDLPPVVGPLPVAVLAAYSPLAPSGARLPAERVNWAYPEQPDAARPGPEAAA